MKIDIDKSKDLFVEHAETIEKILRHAVQQALLEHKRAGNPIASWENGKVVLISPDKITIDNPTETQ